MHDSDLVQTISSLTKEERQRLIAFCESAGRKAGPKPDQDSTTLLPYVIECLDKLDDNLSADNIQLIYAHEGSFNRNALERRYLMAYREVADVVRNDLGKRIPGIRKQLKSLLQFLSIAERSKLLNALKVRSIADKETLMPLIRVMIQHLDEYENALSDESVFKHLYRDAPFHANKLAKIRTETLKSVRRFIALETVRGNMTELQELVFVQQFFRDRNFTGQYDHIRKLVLRHLQEQANVSSSDFYQYFLSDVQHHHQLIGLNESSQDQNLWNTIRSLDEYYLVERLLYTCILLNLNRLRPLALPPFESWFLFDLKSPHLKWFFDKPAGRLFAMTIEMLNNEKSFTELDYDRYVQLIRNHEQQLGDELKLSFEVFAINFGIWRANNGMTQYMQKVFDIQKHKCATGRVYYNGFIMAAEFQSIATLGLWLGEFDWVKDFIETNHDKVSGSMPSQAYYEYCYAQYLYFTKMRLEALNILMDADYEDLQCKMASRILEVKILCELDMLGETKLKIDEQLEARIEAGKLFFYRLKDVPLQMAKIRKRFMDTMGKIVAAKSALNRRALENLLTEVKQIDYIAERKWLMGVIEEYIKKSGK